VYTIDIHHKGDKKPTTYAILKKEEADEKNLPYKYWREADEGEYGLSDDNYVAKVISKSIYKPSSVYIRYPYGYTFYNPNYDSVRLKASGRKSNTTISGKTSDMVREELQKLLQEHGLTEAYTLELLEETIKKAKDKGDVTNLMRAVDNLQDMHGMKEKHQVKVTEQIEATSNTKLIDDLKETEEKLIATKTTTTEE
jgi:hypothetical protein